MSNTLQSIVLPKTNTRAIFYPNILEININHPLPEIYEQLKHQLHGRKLIKDLTLNHMKYTYILDKQYGVNIATYEGFINKLIMLQIEKKILPLLNTHLTYLIRDTVQEKISLYSMYELRKMEGYKIPFEEGQELYKQRYGIKLFDNIEFIIDEDKNDITFTLDIQP